MRPVAAIALAIALATPAGSAHAQDFFGDIDWYTAYRAGYFVGDFEATDDSNDSLEGDVAGIESSIALGGGFMDFGVAELELVYQYDTESELEFPTGQSSALEKSQNFMLGAIANAGVRFDYDIFRFSALAGVGYGTRYLEFENTSGTFEEGQSAGALLLQARLGAELRVNDNWGIETFYRYRYEDTGQFEFDNFNADIEISNDHMIGLGLVYSFGGPERGASRASTAASVPTTERFSGFPPPADGPTLQTAALRADDAFAARSAPPPTAIAELRDLRQRLSDLEDQAPGFAPHQSALTPPRDFPAALSPYGGRDAPPLAATAFRPRSMASIVAEMRRLRSDLTGEPEPADPFFGGI